MVGNGQLTGAQAAEVLKGAHARGVTIEEVMADRSSKEDEIQRANEVIELLKESGVVSKEDMVKAEISRRSAASLVGRGFAHHRYRR